MYFLGRISLIVAAFIIAGCGGSPAGSTASPKIGLVSSTPSTTATKTEISGQVTYDRVPHLANAGLDYENTIRKPVRGALLEAVDASGTVLATTLLDEGGRYNLTVDTNTDVRLQIKAQLRSESDAVWDFKVTDNTQGNQLYALQGSLASTGQNSQQTRNLHAAHGWSGQAYEEVRAAAPFAILDSVFSAVQAFVDIDPNIEFPALELRWSAENKTLVGQRALGQIGTSAYIKDAEDGGAIYILGEAGRDTDEFDPHVILHEWAHYFEHQISRTDSIGGLHALTDRLDARVAFSEGWGNALSAIVTGDPVYRDSSGENQAAGFSFDIETYRSPQPGWFNEASIGAVIYDIFDEAPDEGDRLSEGLSPIYEVMQSDSYKETPVFATIFALADGLRQNLPQDRSALNALLESHSISGQGPDGSGERNSGAIRSALPIYKEVRVNGGSAQLCSVDDAGLHNKLGNREFIFLNLEKEQRVTLSLVKISGDEDRDPDFNIWSGATLIEQSASSAKGEEVYQGRLPAGDYVIEAFDFFNINGAGPKRGDGCYRFTAEG